MYAQKNGLKYRLIRSDIEDIKAREKQLEGRPEAQLAERSKITQLKKSLNIKPSVALFNIIQLPIHTSVFLL